MVWNCPHCRAALALSDEVLGSSWNVSQCPNCENSGFIRRPGNHAVKVDKIPLGERVLIAKTIAKPAPLPQKVAGTSSMTVEGKTPWPIIPMNKPVIRPAVRRNLKPATPAVPLATPAPQTAIQHVAQAIADATVVLKTEEPTKMVVLNPEPESKPEPETKMITPPEFTREILQDSGLIDKDSLTRSFQIPKMEMIMAVGHSVKGSRRKKKSENTEVAPIETAIPEPLPDLLPPQLSTLATFLSEITTVLPTLAFLVISGFIGWNAVRYTHGTSDSHREVVDRLSQRAMAPLRAARASSKDVYPEKYNEKLSIDDPTQLRTRSTEVQAYAGPGAEYNPTGILKPGHLYSVLEKDGNWIKFALDQTHAAWVSIAGVDLIR